MEKTKEIKAYIRESYTLLMYCKCLYFYSMKRELLTALRNIIKTRGEFKFGYMCKASLVLFYKVIIW